MPSKLELYSFPRLKSAIQQDTASPQHGYKSGATFSGHLEGMKRVGQGSFYWPNGDCYTGQYADNMRHGKGEQVWGDGAKFVGEFVRDTRHGKGKHTWPNGEVYEGDYFKDYRHGYGVYTWPDGSTFKGTFYKNYKEGYGVFKFANSSKFEGLYKSGERLGPGVLTYPDGCQDVGLWHNERLVKFCTPIQEAFTMQDHTDFDYDPQEHVLSIDQSRTPDLIQNGTILGSDPDGSGDAGSNLREAMDMLSRTRFSTNFESFQSSQQDSFDVETLEYDAEEYDKAFFPQQNGEMPSDNILAYNNTPFLIEMQKHTFNHRHREETVTLSPDRLLEGDRCNHKDKGPIEQASERLIENAAAGDWASVQTSLMKAEVNVNVADKTGHTALIGAAVNMHGDIINCLLDNGADVNKLNNEGLSALAACHVLFYPIETFQYNIAERYLPRPPMDAGRSLTLQRVRGKGKMEQREGASSIRSLSSWHQDALETPCSSRQSEPDEALHDEDEEEEEDQGEEEDENIEVAEDELSDEGPFKEPTEDEDEEEFKASPDRDLPTTAPQEFESNISVSNFGIRVTEDMVERSATVMSRNARIVSGTTSKCIDPTMDPARRRAIQKAEHVNMEATIRLLLKRGADPNASSVPMPAIFFAVKAADVDAVQILLEKGAATHARLSPKKEGLAPLHIASAIRGQEGVQITKLILETGADPNVRAQDMDIQESETPSSPASSPSKPRPGLDDSVSVILRELEERGDHMGGRTPLHIACDRDDNHELARQVVHLLLDNGANPNVLCNGQSPLSLAIASGNDPAIDKLLSYGANPSLPLSAGIGSALCVAANTAYEFRRNAQQRIALIDKLVKAGANILAPVPVGSKKQMGTAVDYAYWMFNQDRRIAHMPYHALTHAERDTYNARRKLSAHLGDILRGAAVRREKERLELEAVTGARSSSPSQGFLYTGAGAKPGDDTKPLAFRPGTYISSTPKLEPESKQVVFHGMTKDNCGGEEPLVDKEGEVIVSKKKRKPLFKYCYECGRSLGVRLSACTRCKEVYYCSKACKIKAWNARHKEECLRLGGRSRSPSPTASTRAGVGGSGGGGPGGGGSMSGSITRGKGVGRDHAYSPTPATHSTTGKNTGTSLMRKSSTGNKQGGGGAAQKGGKHVRVKGQGAGSNGSFGKVDGQGTGKGVSGMSTTKGNAGGGRGRGGGLVAGGRVGDGVKGANGGGGVRSAHVGGRGTGVHDGGRGGDRGVHGAGGGVVSNKTGLYGTVAGTDITENYSFN